MVIIDRIAHHTNAINEAIVGSSFNKKVITPIIHIHMIVANNIFLIFDEQLISMPSHPPDENIVHVVTNVKTDHTWHKAIK